MNPLRRIKSAWRRNGASGFVRLVGKNLTHYAGELSPARLAERVARQRSDFDLDYGTDTDRIAEVGALGLDHEPNSKHANRYEPSPVGLVRGLVDALSISHGDYTFIDYGSGKGRVVMVAAELPFKAVLGIELSSDLSRIANQNLARLIPSRRLAGQVQCLQMDATQFEMPLTPLVCYFYNPFGRDVMKAVADRLERSYLQKPRDVFVVYVNAVHRSVFDDADCWRLQPSDSVSTGYGGSDVAIFRAVGATLLASGTERGLHQELRRQKGSA